MAHEPPAELPWPQGCHDTASCAEHRACGYIKCPHSDRDIALEVEAEIARLNVACDRFSAAMVALGNDATLRRDPKDTEITRLRAALDAETRRAEGLEQDFFSRHDKERLAWLEWHFEALSRAECRRQYLNPDELISDGGHLAWQLVGYEAAVKERGTTYQATRDVARAEGPAS